VDKSPIRVLLVEDNPGDARLIQEMLFEVKNTSFKLEWVDRLFKALDRLPQGNIDVVLLDLTMPDSSGLDTFTRLHSQNPRVPIIPLTGIDDETFAMNALRAGAQDYLVKGEVESKLLAGAIRYAIERKKVELAFRQNEKRYRALFESTGTATLVVENDGTIRLANAEFEKLTGCSKQDLEGKRSWKEFVVQDDLDPILQHERTGGNDSDPTPSTHDLKLIDRFGNVKHIFMTTARIPETETHVVSLLDVTKRKKMEDELLRVRQLESIGVLAGGLAHDFNNILTAIMGNISLARIYAKPEDKVLAKLSEAEKGAMRAQELTRQLLTFAKGGAPVKQTTSIAELLKDTVSFSLAGSNVRCEFSIPCELWCVEADEGKMSQVINNLIVNADQAMPNGGTIELCAENVCLPEGSHRAGLPLREGRYVRFSIRDHGVGIPPEQLRKVFDPFFTTKAKGSGLGLAIAYSVVERHDGHIAVESKPGEGTVFYVYLPASNRLPYCKPEADERILCGVGKVLVMDDEEIIRELARDMLAALGYLGDFVKEGEEAIEFYRRALSAGKPYDAIIMDLTVPGGMGGKEAVEKILRLDPCAKAIVSSGYANDPIMADYRKYGFVGAVPKPYRISDLSRTLKQVLSGNPAPSPDAHPSTLLRRSAGAGPGKVRPVS
jgi:two-component system, cell cycle sensor histidine kinase and response regulator CckA